jgi:integrase
MTEKGTLSDITTDNTFSPRPVGQEFYGPGAFSAGAGELAPGLDLAARALDLAATAAQASRYASASKAASTRRAYELDWREFTSWCAVRGLQAMPAQASTVALYLADGAGRLAVATLARRLVSIGAAHKAAGVDNPTTAPGVRVVWAGIQRTHGVAQRRKTPLVLAALRQALAELPLTLRGTRDQALLLVGFAGALRRSELVALDVDDLELVDEGVILHVRRGKTDQTGAGRLVGIPTGASVATSPTGALATWLAAAGIQSGPVFRGVSSTGKPLPGRLTDRQVARVVKRACELAGLHGDYSGHSLRAGLATSAAAAGASERAIMAQTGHKSIAIARTYIRPASLFEANAAALAGL